MSDPESIADAHAAPDALLHMTLYTRAPARRNVALYGKCVARRHAAWSRRGRYETNVTGRIFPRMRNDPQTIAPCGVCSDRVSAAHNLENVPKCPRLSLLHQSRPSTDNVGVTRGYRFARKLKPELTARQAYAKRSPTLRSRVTNNPLSIRGVDGRTDEARRFRDLVIAFVDDLGGVDQVGEADKALARQTAAAVVSSEKVQARIIAGDIVDLEQATRLANVAGRFLKALRGRYRPIKPAKTLADVLAGRA